MDVTWLSGAVHLGQAGVRPTFLSWPARPHLPYLTILLRRPPHRSLPIPNAIADCFVSFPRWPDSLSVPLLQTYFSCIRLPCALGDSGGPYTSAPSSLHQPPSQLNPFRPSLSSLHALFDYFLLAIVVRSTLGIGTSCSSSTSVDH